jgi:hypothetical protein
MRLLRYPPIHVGHPQATPETIAALNIIVATGLDVASPRMPPSYSIQSKMTPARNQGSGPCCTVFACTAALEYLYHQPASGDLDLSEGECCDLAFRGAGKCATPDAGTSNADVLAILRDHGLTALLTCVEWIQARVQTNRGSRSW